MVPSTCSRISAAGIWQPGVAVVPAVDVEGRIGGLGRLRVRLVVQPLPRSHARGFPTGLGLIVEWRLVVRAGDVGHDALVAGRVVPQQHGSVADAVHGRERRFDLAQLDPKGAQLHLLVDPAEKLNVPFRQKTPQIAAPVQPLGAGAVHVDLEEMLRGEYPAG